VPLVHRAHAICRDERSGAAVGSQGEGTAATADSRGRPPDTGSGDHGSSVASLESLSASRLQVAAAGGGALSAAALPAGSRPAGRGVRRRACSALGRAETPTSWGRSGAAPVQGRGAQYGCDRGGRNADPEPAAQRLRASRKAGPALERKQPTRRSKQRPVSGRVLRPPVSAPQDRHLVAQNHDFELALTATAGEQTNANAKEPVQQTGQQDAQSEPPRP
jgi:hypothetical protein